MCIIIDTNTLASVFQSDSANHKQFKPVLDWIRFGKGKIVYGGTKYLNEIPKRYLGIFNELKNMNKAERVDSVEVDIQEQNAASKIKHSDFDDQHLVGLLVKSGCRLICSCDKRAYDFFVNSQFFPRKKTRPKIYSGLRSLNILNDRNIASICHPCKSLNKVQQQQLNNILIKKL